MKNFILALRSYIYLTVLLGLLYPAFVTLIGQFTFSKQANGSLVQKDGKIIGSELIAQKFESDRYFWPRPSAVDFNPLPSGGSNLGPTSLSLKEAMVARQAKAGDVAPQSLLFSSASGLDPEIDPKAAAYQIPRIAKARGMPEENLRSIVASITERRQLGFLGEERVNVLRLNLALDEVR